MMIDGMANRVPLLTGPCGQKGTNVGEFVGAQLDADRRARRLGQCCRNLVRMGCLVENRPRRPFAMAQLAGSLLI